MCMCMSIYTCAYLNLSHKYYARDLAAGGEMQPVSSIESKTSQTRSMRGGANHPTTQIYRIYNGWCGRG